MELDFELHQRSTETYEEEAPPSYHASLRSNIKDTNFLSRGRLNAICQQDRLPTTKWFVRSTSAPSIWQLLASRSLMSNVTRSENSSPTQKRRYSILYPARKYEDVYLHRPPWAAQASCFPSYHIEIYSGRVRYNTEPIIVLGPPGSVGSSPTMAEVKALACLNTLRVIFAVENQVKDMTRQATFAEMEFFSWNWTMKTTAANYDMRTMILGAKEQCARSGDLLQGLQSLLVFVGDDAHVELSASLRRSYEVVRRKLERLRL